MLMLGRAISHLAHADDMVIVSRSWRGLRRHLCRLEVWYKANMLDGSKSHLEQLFLGGMAIPYASSHKYVGVHFWLTTRNIFADHCEAKADAAHAASRTGVFGLELLGRGRVPPELGIQLFSSLADCHHA
ncbi:hypothetical protein BDZ89DRAFT_1056548 [Hymenopellis radicata]|nr:hypothetical protein BDZ89DRAFT_1056548 [Hymenopellis radicata]